MSIKPVMDTHLDDAIAVIRGAGLQEFADERAEAYRIEQGRHKGGRPARLKIEQVVIAMMILILENSPMEMVDVAELLRDRLTTEQRQRFGVPKRGNERAECWYDWAQRTLSAFEDSIDPTPRIDRRRRGTQGEYMAAKEKVERDPNRHEREWAMHEIMNRIVWTAARMMPAEYVPSDSTVVWDATNIPTMRKDFQRGKKFDPTGVQDPDTPITMLPEGGRYYRESMDHSPEGLGRKAVKKSYWAFEGSVAIQIPYDPDKVFDSPIVAVGINHHPPAADPAGNTIRVLEWLKRQGVQIREFLADRQYNEGVTADTLPAYLHRNEIERVIDFKSENVGVKGQYEGIIQMGGRMYCPMLPDRFKTLGKRATEAYNDYKSAQSRNEDPEWQRFDEEFETLKKYEFRQKQSVNENGSVPVMCPAQGSGMTAMCPARPESMKVDPDGRPRLPILLDRPVEDLPKCCTNATSITVPEDASDWQFMKYGQSVAFRSPEWYRSYNRRSLIEGFFATLKHEQDLRIDDYVRIKKRGKVSHYLFFALTVAVANLHRIREFLEKRELAEFNGGIEARNRKASRKAQLDDRRKGRVRPATGKPNSAKRERKALEGRKR